MRGKVYLVGAGPGDPALLTLRGKSILERADCVVYDFLVSEALLSFCPPHCEKVFAGKRAGRHAMTQDAINALMIGRAGEGRIVVRLKGGDPFVFGRGGEEAEALAGAGVEFEVVPGVSAGHAVPAYAGIPLTHRGTSSEATFLTGHEELSGDSALPGFAQQGTLVVFMGARKLHEIAESLIRRGRDPSTPAAVIRWGTTPDQEVITAPLAEIGSKAADVYPPVIAVIGDVVSLRERLAWYEKLPLFGRRIVVTRPAAQAAALSGLLMEQGAQPVEIPAVELREPASWEAMDNAIRAIASFDYLLVTSVNGVRRFVARLQACGYDARRLSGLEIGAIGPATAAEFARHGIRVDFVPREYRGEGLLEALAGRDLGGKSFLIPRARVARDLVPQELRNRGARVEVVEAYYAAAPSYRPDQLEALLTPFPHVLTFTSSSTAINFYELAFPDKIRSQLEKSLVASIGPATSSTLAALGKKVDIEARESTIPGLVKALEEHFGRR